MSKNPHTLDTYPYLTPWFRPFGSSIRPSSDSLNITLFHRPISLCVFKFKTYFVKVTFAWVTTRNHGRLSKPKDLDNAHANIVGYL